MIYAILPCHQARLEDLEALVTSIELPRTDIRLVVVTTLPTPILSTDLPFDFDIVHTNSDEVNFAKWYNIGMTFARAEGAIELLWLESDVRMTYECVLALQRGLREGYILVGPNYYNDVRPLKTDLLSKEKEIDRVIIGTMIKAETLVEADERYEWWYEMDDIHYQLRERGPVAIVHDAIATHTGYEYFDMPLDKVEKTRRGRQLFLEKWGEEPFEYHIWDESYDGPRPL